jgi:ADP-ribosylglycohydrolase
MQVALISHRTIAAVAAAVVIATATVEHLRKRKDF